MDTHNTTRYGVQLIIWVGKQQGHYLVYFCTQNVGVSSQDSSTVAASLFTMSFANH